MLKEGDLPSGYGVHRRALVRVDSDGRPLTKRTAKKARTKVKVTKKITKSELATAVKNEKKKSGKKKSLAA